MSSLSTFYSLVVLAGHLDIVFVLQTYSFILYIVMVWWGLEIFKLPALNFHVFPLGSSSS